MEIDFSALASRVAAFSDVLGCVILSSNDALVLGAFPPGDEDGVKPAWLKFAQVGEPDRGFVKFGDEVWAYVNVGQYAAFAVAGAKTRPGVLRDHLEQALLVADESRGTLQMARAPGRVEIVAGARPKAVAPEQPAAPKREEDRSKAEEPPTSEQPSEIGAEATIERIDGSDKNDEESKPESEEQPLPPLEEAEIDPVALAREFAGLLQEDTPGDEGNGNKS